MKDAVDHWDAVIVGAGVAGGCMAALLADRGWRVLLVEKSTWPRETVCGGCLSAAAVNSLHEIGMGSVINDAAETRSVVWQSGGSTFEHAIPAGVSILRSRLDAGIVDNAIRRGVHFLPACCASLLPVVANESRRLLELHTDQQTTLVQARWVIACDGINGTLLKDEPWASWTINPHAPMGVAATYECSAKDLLPGRIHMCIGKHGYVGLVRINHSTVHLAAAVDPAGCKDAGGLLNVIGDILRSNGRSVSSSLGSARLYGTGKLTRHRKQLGGHRVLTLGDACGYVEPVTGEGMAWAAAGALELNRLIPRSSVDGSEDLCREWTYHHSQTIGRQQRWCQMLTMALHHPMMIRGGILLGNTMPAVAEWIARVVCQPPHKEFLNDPIGHVTRASNRASSATGHSGNRYRKSTGGTAGIIP